MTTSEPDTGRHQALEERAPRRVNGSTIAWGAALLTVGLVMLLDQMNLLDRSFLHDWWPVALIVVGVLTRGWFFAAIGTWFLISKLELFGLTWGTSWPLILMVIGAGIIIDAIIGRSRRRCATHPSVGDHR